MLWSGIAGLYGFAVLARSHLMEVAFDRKIIPDYATADPAFQQAVQVVAGLALDVPDGFLTCGAIGVWIVTVSALGVRTNACHARSVSSGSPRGPLRSPASSATRSSFGCSSCRRSASAASF